MPRKLLMAVAATLALVACDKAEPIAEKIIPEEKPKTLAEIDPVAYKANTAAAMDEVPLQLRPAFQKLFICEMKRNSKLAEPKPVTADYMRKLAEHLKKNPTAGDVCNA